MTEEPQDHERRHWQTVEVAHHASHLAGRLREAENAIGRFLSECQEFERHATEVGIRLSSHPSLPGTSWQPAIQVERWNEYDPEQRSAIVHALLLCIDWHRKIREWNFDPVRADVVSESGEILQNVHLREGYYQGPIA